MNLKFTISYDGFSFKGSQKQPCGNTIEDELIKAFSKINIKTKIVLSGRTDRDVHASGQVFNCVVPTFWEDKFEKLKEVLNRLLPLSIKIKHICKVCDDFHARFSAKSREYRYIISTKPLSPFNARYVTYVEKVDEDLMKKAIKEFVGIYDFEYFHKLGSDNKSTVREIYSTSFYKYKDIYVFKFCANAYLRSQIRLMVGFLLQINEGKLSCEDLKKQLNKEKQCFRVPALPNGLYLAKIKY